MSVEVALTLEDYHNLMNWYELAFGKDQGKQKEEDQNAFKKITVMCLSKMEEVKNDAKE